MGRQVIITIGRSFGSNGKKIGERLAKELGIGFYDRKLIHMAAEKSGIKKKVIRNADEKILGKFTDIYTFYGLGSEGTNEKIFLVQSAVIKDIFDSGESCVIVGRLADYVLSDYDNVMNVFVFAPFEYRVKEVMARYDLTENQAERVVRRVDKERRNYYQYFSDENWDRKEGKDLLFDSSRLGVNGGVELLKTMAYQRFGKEAFE